MTLTIKKGLAITGVKVVGLFMIKYLTKGAPPNPLL